MTDLHALFLCRFKQAEETLHEAEKMLTENFSARSIINRSYYAMFYMLLSLFLKTGVSVKTSKHRGIITIFDKEFVYPGKIDKKYSKLLHNTFLARLENDYQEMALVSTVDTSKHVKAAAEFIDEIKNYLNKLENETSD